MMEADGKERICRSEEPEKVFEQDRRSHEKAVWWTCGA